MTRSGRSCSSRKFTELCELLLYNCHQAGSPILHGSPNEELEYTFVVVPVDVAAPGHLDPRNIRVPRLHVIGKSPRRFGDDLQSPRHRIKEKLIVAEGGEIDAFDESAGKPDVVTDIEQPFPRKGRLRRHKPRAASRRGERRM